MKRRLREIFRLHRLPAGIDVVVNVRRGASELTPGQLESEFLGQLRTLSRRCAP